MTSHVAKDQLELSLKGTFKPRLTRRQRRLATARSWFQEMHRAVDQACEWAGNTTPMPEPMQLKLRQAA